MKIARVEYKGTTRFGVVTDNTSLKLLTSDWILGRLFESNDQIDCTSEIVALESIRILAPIEFPPKIICIGKNYADHAQEMGGESPELPIIFSKFSSCIAGPEQPVILPKISEQVDYEGELVVVIGRPGKNIARHQALHHVMGYTCGNDVSARDWQKGRPGGQWLLGKSFDTFAPIGPFLVTPEEIPDVQQLTVSLRLNGQVMQSANTSLMLYPVDYLISYVSKFFALQTGDLIFTGTPAGVGAGRNPPVFLKAGDVTEVTISELGTLKNPFKKED